MTPDAAAPPGAAQASPLGLHLDALDDQQRSHLTAPFPGSNRAVRSGVGETRFAHAAILRPSPSGRPLRADSVPQRSAPASRLTSGATSAPLAAQTKSAGVGSEIPVGRRMQGPASSVERDRGGSKAAAVSALDHGWCSHGAHRNRRASASSPSTLISSSSSPRSRTTASAAFSSAVPMPRPRCAGTT